MATQSYNINRSILPIPDIQHIGLTGRINWVQIDLGKAEDADHYISPEERIRVAMARQ